MITLCIRQLLCSIIHKLVLAELTCHDHSIIACSRRIYMRVVLRAHPVCGESHIQRNANREVATIAINNLQY